MLLGANGRFSLSTNPTFGPRKHANVGLLQRGGSGGSLSVSLVARERKKNQPDADWFSFEIGTKCHIV